MTTNVLGRCGLGRTLPERQMLLGCSELSVFQTLPKEHRDAVAEEGERFVRFMAGPEVAEASEIQFIETT